MRILLMPLLVSLSCSIAGGAAAVELLWIDADLSSDSDQLLARFSAPDETSSALQAQAAERVIGASQIAAQMMVEDERRRVVLESVGFSRSDGSIKARAIFWDGAGPRGIRMHLDAFGSGFQPIASFPFDFVSTGERQPISISSADSPSFERFSLRFSSEGKDLELVSTGSESLEVSPVSPTTMLFHADYGELRQLLDEAGYIAAQSYEPDAMLGAVRRFRRDNGLVGPEFVTLGDLFALRLVLDKEDGETSLAPYVEWASALRGGREASRPEYVPSKSLSLSVPVDDLGEASASGIYDEMDPPAEEERAKRDGDEQLD